MEYSVLSDFSFQASMLRAATKFPSPGDVNLASKAQRCTAPQEKRWLQSRSRFENSSNNGSATTPCSVCTLHTSHQTISRWRII